MVVAIATWLEGVTGTRPLMKTVHAVTDESGFVECLSYRRVNLYAGTVVRAIWTCPAATLRVGSVGEAGREAPVRDVEDLALRRRPYGASSPWVIRTTARNRFDSELIRAAVAIAAATTGSTPTDQI